MTSVSVCHIILTLTQPGVARSNRQSKQITCTSGNLAQ